MNDEAEESIRWTDFSIVCPHCGNRGESGGEWEMNAWSPFKLIEEVIRSWLFVPQRQEDGSLLLVADRRPMKSIGRAARIYASSACSASATSRCLKKWKLTSIVLSLRRLLFG